MILEIEIFGFGVSVLWYMVRFEKRVEHISTILSLCPNCPKKQGGV